MANARILLEKFKLAHEIIHVLQAANRPVHPLVNMFGHLTFTEGNRGVVHAPYVVNVGHAQKTF